MKRKLNCFFLVYLSVLTIGIIFILINFEVKRSDYIFKLVNCASAIAAITIGYLFFDGYGIRKKIKEKQFENVTKIIEELNGLMISTQIFKASERTALTFQFKKCNVKKYGLDYLNGINKPNENIPIYFIVNDWIPKINVLYTLSASPFTPKNIQESTKSLVSMSFLGNLNEFNTKETKLIFGKMIDSNFIPCQLDGKQKLLGEFFFEINEIYVLCKQWLSENAIEADLNL